MKNILIPVSYFPPLSCFHLIIKNENICFELYEHFPKQTFRNRCSIYSPNGIQQMVIPLHDRKDKTITKDIRISYEQKWQTLHWRSLESAYRSSPYFEYYEDDFRPLYEKKFDFLVDFNLELMQVVFSLMKMKRKISFTKGYEKIPADIKDCRDVLNKKNIPSVKFPRYAQVFEDRHGFISNLSIADLLFNQGNEAKDYLREITE